MSVDIDINSNKFTVDPKLYKSDQYIRWCPGCGDHAIVNSLYKALAELNIPRHKVALISGIGCSSRLPYYMNTYGFHTIHGRGAAIASGVKIANPELSVWLATGDGDCLAIGGNHFIHTVRRNINLNILLFNNKIYGLTKGQYSPTSEKGFISKSSPDGTIERPFIPAELTIGARGTFFARCVDVDLRSTTQVLVEAEKHIGTSVVEILQNCVIFNDDIHKNITDKDFRANNTITLRHGERMIFGINKDKGIVVEGWNLKAVTINQNGYTLNDVLIHDETLQDSTLHLKLALMHPETNGMPLALGVIRNVEQKSYDQEMEEVLGKKIRDSKINNLVDLLMNGDIWEVK